MRLTGEGLEDVGKLEYLSFSVSLGWRLIDMPRMAGGSRFPGRGRGLSIDVVITEIIVAHGKEKAGNVPLMVLKDDPKT